MTGKKRNRDKPLILVVEDSRTQALHLKMMLEEAGVDVIVASDGQMGLKKARELYPTVVILDVEMPKMSGLQVCEQLKGRPDTSTIPIIMLTSHGNKEAYRVLTRNLGVVDYIVKDAFSDAILMELLRQMGFIRTQRTI